MKTLHALKLSVLLAACCVGVVQAQANGQQLYQARCAMCHQADGEGAAGVAPPLKGAHWEKLSAVRTYVPGVLLAGMNGPLQLDSGSFVGIMPPQNQLSDDEIAALANYLMTTLNPQPAWTGLQASDVAGLRKSPPSVSQLRSARKQAVAQ